MSVAEPFVSPRSTPKTAAFWGGWFLTGFVTLFLVFDGVAKVLKVEPVLEACDRLEVPERVVPVLGMVLVGSVVLYVVPSTSVLGAIVLTGYLGGAVWTHVRLGGPWFPVVFPVIVGVMAWGGLALREPRLRGLVPLRWPVSG